MFYYKLLIVLGACLSWSHCKLDRYCAICEDHTMCKYHDIGKDCENVGASGVTEAERKEIVDTHNWLRRIVASGYETRGSGGTQPKAANLRKLNWDEELSKVAQRWADQCRFMHDSCRNDPRWKVGQNIYWAWKYPKHQVNWTEAIFSWYNEVSLYNPNEVNSYRFETATGHYTQMLWHETYAIGCGRRDYGENKLYVCNYGPTGNWIGEPLYAVGEPCSKCPQGTFCDEYLCEPKNPELKIESQAKTKVIENVLRDSAKVELTPKTINETSLEILKPPRETSESLFSSKGVKTKPHRTLNQTQDNQVEDNDQKVLTYVLLEIQEETTTNSIDENDIELDSDTKKGIEDIKVGIENLVKSIIKKLKGKK